MFGVSAGGFGFGVGKVVGVFLVGRSDVGLWIPGRGDSGIQPYVCTLCRCTPETETQSGAHQSQGLWLRSRDKASRSCRATKTQQHGTRHVF